MGGGTNDTLVIDTQDLTGIASLAVDDPRRKADQQVSTCVDTDSTQSRWVPFTVCAAAGAGFCDTVKSGRHAGECGGTVRRHPGHRGQGSDAHRPTSGADERGGRNQ